MADTMVKPGVDEIVNALREDAGELDFNPQESRVFIQALRLLTEGRPISSDQVEQIAAGHGLTGEEANAALNWVAERNDDGHIVGLAGLSLNNWGHKFNVGGQAMTTWCALDTLYLTHIIRQPVEVESPDPVTNETIRVTFGSDQVEGYTPSSAVVSIVIPKVKEKGLESAEEIWTAFCNYSLYFTSTETALEWFADKHVEPVFLTVEEAHELGGKWFQKVIQYA